MYLSLNKQREMENYYTKLETVLKGIQIRMFISMMIIFFQAGIVQAQAPADQNFDLLSNDEYSEEIGQASDGTDTLKKYSQSMELIIWPLRFLLVLLLLLQIL